MGKLVTLPKLAFFTQKNMTTGSVTPEDLVGRPLEPIFNYRVYMQDDALMAEYYIDSKCYELTDKEKICRHSIAVSDDGIRETERWLEAEYAEYERHVGY